MSGVMAHLAVSATTAMIEASVTQNQILTTEEIRSLAKSVLLNRYFVT